MKRAHLHVSGLVQGVCFRAYTCDEARALGVSGWVRNLPDGRVEVVVEGPREALDRFVAWCRHGPPVARVSEVRVEWGEASGEFTGFHIAR